MYRGYWGSKVADVAQLLQAFVLVESSIKPPAKYHTKKIVLLLRHSDLFNKYEYLIDFVVNPLLLSRELCCTSVPYRYKT
jgi:hypothetical protein